MKLRFELSSLVSESMLLTIMLTTEIGTIRTQRILDIKALTVVMKKKKSSWQDYRHIIGLHDIGQPCNG